MLKSGVYRCNDLYIHPILRFSNFNKGFRWFVYTCITFGVKKCLGKKLKMYFEYIIKFRIFVFYQ